MYRTKTNVFVHRTLLVLFFPSLFCQKTGFLIATDCCDSENKYIPILKKCQELNRDFLFFFIKKDCRVKPDNDMDCNVALLLAMTYTTSRKPGIFRCGCRRSGLRRSSRNLVGFRLPELSNGAVRGRYC